MSVRLDRSWQRIRIGIVLGCVLLWALIGGLTASWVGQTRALIVEAGRQDVAQIAASTEADVNRALMGIDLLLADMGRWAQADRPSPTKASAAAASPDQTHLLQRLLLAGTNQNLMIRNLALVDVQGQVQVAARDGAIRLGLSLPDGFLATVMAQPYPALAVSPPVTEGHTFERVLYMARAVPMPGGGKLAAVAEIHVAGLSALLNPGPRRERLTLTLERQDGVLLASQPEVLTTPDQRLTPPLDTLDTGGEARLSTGRLQPAQRFWTVVRPTLYPQVLLSVAVPEEALAQTVQAETRAGVAVAAGLALLTLLAAAAGWHYAGYMQQAQRERAEALASLTATVEALPDLLFEVDGEGRYLDCRTSRPELLAAPADQLLMRTVDEVLPPEAAAQIHVALAEALATGHSHGHTIALPLPDGSVRWFEASTALKTPHATQGDAALGRRVAAHRQDPGVARSAAPVPGPTHRFVFISRDVTERKQAEEGLRVAALVYQTSSEGMAVLDADGHIVNINPAFTHITGYGLDEVRGWHISRLDADPSQHGTQATLWRAVQATGQWRGERWCLRKDGSRYAEALTINTIYPPNGGVLRRVALLADITQRKLHEQKIWEQAHYDALTGLPNRHLFRQHLEQALQNARERGTGLALLFMDLDRFKAINDTHGHDAGDELLRIVSQRLRSCVRDGDLVARLGGDEFTLVLSPLSDPQRAKDLAQRIVQRLAEPFRLGDEVEYISGSVGLTLFAHDGANAETLIAQADQAMYAAKRAGRNRWVAFDPAMQEEAAERSRIARDLRTALAQGQFWLAYQPIVDLGSGHIRKAEALIRWQHPVHGLVSPAHFIPVAEEIGLIGEIGQWVFETAVRQVQQWQARLHPDFQIGVNKSPLQFREHAQHGTSWVAQLQDLGLASRSIVVEITEGLLMDSSEAVQSHLRQLREAGVPIALDDFGTGYSALSYLHQYELDYLKIDQSFVGHLHSDSKDLALCKATILMAHELGMQVVAEGIETEEQRQLLLQAGCDLGQGYLFARPMPAAEFEAFALAHNSQA